MDWLVGSTWHILDLPDTLPNVKVEIVLMQPFLLQKEGVCWHADGNHTDLTFNLLAELILHLKGGLEDTKGLDVISIRHDDDRCIIVKRFLSQFWPSCTPSTSHAPCWKVLSALFPCLLQQLLLPDNSAPPRPPIRTSSYPQLLLFFLLSFFLISHLANSTKSQVRSRSMSSSGLVSNHIHSHCLSLPS